MGVRRGALALLIAAACALLAVGCGGSGGGGAEKGKPATLTVGVIPIVDVAPLYLGQQQGFFKQEKLTIKPQLAAGGAAIVPSVVSGRNQFGFSNTTSLIIGASKRLPLQIVAQGSVGGPRPTAKDAYDAVLVKGNGPIRSPADLEGKTVAVNTLQNVGPLTVNTTLKKRGVDYRKVKYVEIPFPDMNAAIEQGRVDAGWMVEPFVTQGTSQGNRALLYPFEQTTPNLTVATYFAAKPYIDKNPDVVDRFVRAMNKSLDYAEGHPAEVRKVVPTYTKIPAPVAQKMVLPHWGSDLRRPTIETTARLARQYGFVKSEPDLGALIRQP